MKIEKTDFYYRVPLDSDTGKKLTQLSSDATSAETAAHNLAKEFGASAWEPSTIAAYGGIAALYFDKNPGTHWQRISGKRKDALYVPDENTQTGRDRYKLINDLPVVMPHSINDALGISPKNSVFEAIKMSGEYWIHVSLPIGEKQSLPMTADMFQAAKLGIYSPNGKTWVFDQKKFQEKDA